MALLVGQQRQSRVTTANDQGTATCYAIEGNVVDRVSRKNGKGWCVNVAPTLNTQDRHAVCYEAVDDG